MKYVEEARGQYYMALEIKEYIGHIPKKVDEQKLKVSRQQKAVKTPSKRPARRGK